LTFYNLNLPIKDEQGKQAKIKLFIGTRKYKLKTIESGNHDEVLGSKSYE
jgi:hypothetical protein